MEITAISLLAVTDQYLAYLQHWEQEALPLANMAAFVSIAARLLFIKSQSLLPHFSKDEEDNVPESATSLAEELQHHLLEYKQAKKIAQVLRIREEAGLQTYSRSSLLAGIEAQLTWSPPTLVGMEAETLGRAFQHLLALQERAATTAEHLLPIQRVRVSACIATIRNLLQERPFILLTEILAYASSRLVTIVTFIAVLEMWKWERIDVQQEVLMGPIIIEKGACWAEKDLEEIED